jgi:hypothetical protein
MNTHRYQLHLRGLQETEGQIKVVSLRRVLDALLKTAERATRLLATGEGSGRGPKPRWLDASVDFTVIGLNSGSTVLDIEAPRLGETAYEESAQQEFWCEQPNPEDTALDLAALAIEEAGTADTPGDRFDSAVLEAILMFKKAAGIRYQLIPQGSARGGFALNEHVYARIDERLKSLPAPKACIVSGRLDEIGQGGGRFRLLLGQDSYLLGKLDSDSLDTAALWGKPTTVEGIVHFKANGQPRLIEARRMSGCAEGDNVFGEMPSAEQTGQQRLGMAQDGRVRSIDPMVLAGAWPGDEPIDELLAQLD